MSKPKPEQETTQLDSLRAAYKAAEAEEKAARVENIALRLAVNESGNRCEAAREAVAEAREQLWKAVST